MFPELSKYTHFAYDTETTGLGHLDKMFGFSISLPDGQDFYWDVRQTPMAIAWLVSELRKFKGIIFCHNVSFDYRMSLPYDIVLPLSQCRDTKIQACLINEHEFSYTLDDLGFKYCKAQKQGQALYDQLATRFGGLATKNVQMGRISQAPVEVVSPYAKADTRTTLELAEWQMREIKRQDLTAICDFEHRVMPRLIAAEMHGIRVDETAAMQAVEKLCEQTRKMQKALDEKAGFLCNPNGQKDIKKLFDPQWRDKRWWSKEGHPLPMMPAGAASLNADALREMNTPISNLLLLLRSLIKTRDTFLVGHVLESAYNGRVYPTINQTKGEDGGTGTGRLSYVSPAVQQIPTSNKEVAEIVKTVFVPDRGHKWVDCDKASFEVRIFAHLVGTADIVQAYKDDPERDFHQFVSGLTGLVRNAEYAGQPNAKQLNLSMIFNQGNGATAEKMGMPWSWESFVPKDSTTGDEIVYKKAGPEAKEVIDKYHHELPGVAKLAKGCKKVAEQRGYLFTSHGRHLRFPKGYKSYKASGILIQATSADHNKQSWLEICDVLDGTDAKLLLNTHDSYSLSIPEESEEIIAKAVKEAVERDRGLRVPLILEVNEPGNTWWESKSAKRWM